MANNFTLSEAGLNLIRKSEGTVYHLYNDATGNCTVGTGHLVHLGKICGAPSEAPYKYGCSFEQERALLIADTAFASHAVNHLVTVPITQNEFDALVDFTFNAGAGTLEKSHLLQLLNAGDFVDVPAELLKYTRSKGKELPGLVIRRKNEIALFRGK